MALQKTPVDDLDYRRRKLRYRAWHRGTREMDFVMGRFADAELPGMTAADLDQFESLMEAPDPDLFAWVLGQADVPVEWNSAIFRRVVEFHRKGKGARKP